MLSSVPSTKQVLKKSPIFFFPAGSLPLSPLPFTRHNWKTAHPHNVPRQPQGDQVTQGPVPTKNMKVRHILRGLRETMSHSWRLGSAILGVWPLDYVPVPQLRRSEQVFPSVTRGRKPSPQKATAAANEVWLRALSLRRL